MNFDYIDQMMVQESDPLVTKWQKMLDLDTPTTPKLKTDMERRNMAIWLENTSKTLRYSAEATQMTTIFGSEYTPAMMGWTRQTFPKMMGSEMASVVAMDRPTGRFYHLKLLRGDGSDPADFVNWSNYRTYAEMPNSEGQDITPSGMISLGHTDISIGNPIKINVAASLELQQDMPNYFPGMNPMQLLAQYAQAEIARELDAKLVYAAYQAAAANKNITYSDTLPSGYTKEEWRHRLQRAVLIADKEIWKATGLGATWMICGAEAALEIADLGNFTWNPMIGDREEGSFGLSSIGTLGANSNSGALKVFRSRTVPGNKIIVGRKGTSITDGGLFLLSYVPLYVSQVQDNVKNLTSQQSFMSRSSVHVASNKLFALITLNITGDSSITVS